MSVECTNAELNKEQATEHRGRGILHSRSVAAKHHNPIERVWLDMHASVTRNHRHSTMRELGRAVIRFLDNYDRRRTLNPALRPRFAHAA